MEEQQAEDAQEDDPRCVPIRIEKVIEARMNPNPKQKVQHAERETRYGIHVGMGGKVHTRYKHTRRVPNHTHHQQRLGISGR